MDWSQRCTPSDTDIIVVKDPAVVPTELMIVAGLNGSMLVTPEFVASGGASGAALGFRRAVKIKRAFHMTPDFILQNEILAGHIMTIAEQADSCWTAVSCDELIDLAARRKAREVLAFMTATELDDYPLIQNRFTAQTAIANDFVSKLDPMWRRTGVCTGH